MADEKNLDTSLMTSIMFRQFQTGILLPPGPKRFPVGHQLCIIQPSLTEN